MYPVWYTIAVDLGKQRNHTAIAILKRVWYQATTAEFIASGSRGVNRWSSRLLTRGDDKLYCTVRLH